MAIAGFQSTRGQSEVRSSAHQQQYVTSPISLQLSMAATEDAYTLMLWYGAFHLQDDVP